VFSRNCEDRTGAFPDVVRQVLDAAAGSAWSLILDAEVVAVDRPAADGSAGLKLLSFQELAARPRAGVKLEDVTVAVCVFVFDLLYADGESLRMLPLAQRRERLLQVSEPPSPAPGRPPCQPAAARGVRTRQLACERHH
jgi:DNA ligase-1